MNMLVLKNEKGKVTKYNGTKESDFREMKSPKSKKDMGLYFNKLILYGAVGAIAKWRRFSLLAHTPSNLFIFF